MKFVLEPELTFGAARDWGGFGARRSAATPGRYLSRPHPDHRLIVYLTPDVPTECACGGLSQRRVQAPFDFDLAPAEATGSWEDAAPMEMVTLRLAPGLLAETAEALEAPGGRVDLAPKLGGRDALIGHVARGGGGPRGGAPAPPPAGRRAAPAARRGGGGGAGRGGGARAKGARGAGGAGGGGGGPEPAARLYADSLAAALSARLLQDHARPAAPTRQTLSKPQLKRLVEYVETNLADDLSLEELARVAGLSIPHMTTLFRRTMGQSVHSYVMERRVCRARALLLDRALSIPAVAYETGFAHPSHLARWMRRLLGVAPSEIVRS
jgi:AraC family transcriptional regulator